MTRLEQARRMFAQGDYAGAIETAQKLVRLGQQLDDAHNLIGIAAMQTSDFALARRSFEATARLQPRHPGAWLNLGLMAIEIRDHTLAEQATRKLIGLAPGNADYRFMLVTVLSLAGKLDAMPAAIEATLAVKPDHGPARFAQLEHAYRQAAVSEWPALWHGVRGLSLPPLHQAMLAQMQVIHAWVSRADGALFKRLLLHFNDRLQDFLKAEQAAGFDGRALKQREVAKVGESLKGYLGMFLKLLPFAPVPAPDAALPRFWLVGDSHCLPPHGQAVTVDGVRRQVEACLAMGCKLWHLATPADNPHRRALAAALAATPDGALVAVSLGEIDLRPDGGMWPLAQRPEHQGNWRRLVENTIPPALAWLAAHRGRRRLLVLGVPAPHATQVAKVVPALQAEYCAFVAAANAALAAAAQAQGLEFIDLHGVTAGRPELFLDGIHLLPAALAEALAGPKTRPAATEAAA